MRIVFKDQLLQKHKRPLMWNLLSKLNYCIPYVWGKRFSTVITLQILLNESNNHSLLHYHVAHDFPTDCNLNFNPFRVRFSPDKLSINDLNVLRKPLDLLQKHCEHFCRFSSAINPWRATESLASPALEQVVGQFNPACYIYCPIQNC